jgi:hypothetical protein
VSRIRVAVLAAAITLLPIVATEVHGIAIVIIAVCAALVASAVAWSSSTREKKIAIIITR